VSRGPPRELCSREPGHWGEVVRACLKQNTQGFSQSSHTQRAGSMFSRRAHAGVHTGDVADDDVEDDLHLHGMFRTRHRCSRARCRAGEPRNARSGEM